MLGALLVVLLAAGLVAATFFWLGRRNALPEGAAPELIKAASGPYKVRPSNPGGLDVAGESETAYRTSAGQDTDGQLNLSATPEAPVARPKPEPKAEPSPPAEEKKPEVKTEPAPAPTGGKGSVIQLGAFANRAQAERAWSALSTRFPDVAGMNKMVIPFSGGIRLRAGAASSQAAKEVCQKLKVAGENCFVAN